MTAKPTPLERFMAKIIEDTDTGCWLWQGAKDRRGCPYLTDKGTTYVSYRWIYAQTYGAIAPGLEILHTCDVLWCCNPEHLEALTHGERLRRQHLERLEKRGNRCKHGHLLDEANIYVNTRGRQECKTCVRDSLARYKEKRRNHAK